MKFLIAVSLIFVASFANAQDSDEVNYALAQSAGLLDQIQALPSDEGERCFAEGKILSNSDALVKFILQRSVKWTQLDHSRVRELNRRALMLGTETASKDCLTAHREMPSVRVRLQELADELARDANFAVN